VYRRYGDARHHGGIGWNELWILIMADVERLHGMIEADVNAVDPSVLQVTLLASPLRGRFDGAGGIVGATNEEESERLCYGRMMPRPNS